MSKNVHENPPKWPFKILKYLLKDKYRDEIEGDLEEVFHDNVDIHSLRKAKWIFIWDVMKLIRPSLLKNMNAASFSNSMIKNNLKVSLRVFKRNKSYTFINVLSLACGLAIAMLIFSYVRFEMSYENENPLARRLVRISMDLLNGETMIDQDAETYHPLGPRLASEFPVVESYTRAYPLSEVTVQVGDKFFRESKIFVVDSSFFRLFNYPPIAGSLHKIFSNPYETVLTESQAIKYFGRTDVVGESLLMISIFKTPLKITGVVADNPKNTHLKFQMLISYASIKDEVDAAGWSNNNTYTYLLLSDKTDYQHFFNNLRAFNDRIHGEKKLLNERMIAEPVKDIHLYSHKSYEIEQNGDAVAVFFLLSVAIMVIVIAVVNYINLSTAKSLERAKEVGIRKVIGSSLSQLKAQFFTESFLINFFAGALSILLMLVFLPSFRKIAGLPTEFNFWNDPMFWLIGVSIIITGSILSGAFPAFILSSFQPLQVLKGKFSHSRTGTLLRRELVIFQFSITIFLLIQTFTADRQLSFMQHKDLGLDIEQTIVVRAPNQISSNEKESRENYKTFKNQLLAYSQFKSIAISGTVPGQPSGEMGSTNSGVNLVEAIDKHSFNFYIYQIDADFIPTMHMDLKSGENYQADKSSDDEVIVNEEAIKLWGINNPSDAIGRKINLWSRIRTIIGVIKNFSQLSPKSAYLPMIFLHREEGGSFVSIRTQSADVQGNVALIKQIYASVFPNSPFEYFFLDQEFDKQYRGDEQFQQVFGTLTVFAIMISCLGLFGLVSFTVANRTKEIGVRKVLGASITQIVKLLSKDFITLILISMIISISITYFVIQTWLQQYAFRIELNIWLFLLPAAGVLIISLLTIFLKTFQVSSANPVKSLRDE